MYQAKPFSSTKKPSMNIAINDLKKDKPPLTNKYQLQQQQMQTNQMNTVRRNNADSRQLMQQTTFRQKSQAQSSEVQIQIAMLGLATENKLKKQALENANQIIQILQEQNKALMQQLQSLFQKYNHLQQQYSQILNKSTKKSFVSIQQFPSNGHCRRYTALKVYPDKQNLQHISPLPCIEKQIICNEIEDIENKFYLLEEMTRSQLEELSEIKEQNKYMEMYVEDQIFKEEKGMKEQQSYSIVIEEYRRIIKLWELYAGKLKDSLLEAEKFIQNIAHTMIKQDKNNEIQLKDIVMHVSKAIVKIVYDKDKKIQSEKDALCYIIEQLIGKLKRNKSAINPNH